MRSFALDSKTATTAVGDGSDKDGMNLGSNKGGFTIKEYEGILKGVDKDGTLPPNLLSLAAIGQATDFYMSKGDTKNAVKAAKGMLIANKKITQTLGTLALDQLQAGDYQNACKLLNDACTRFPTDSQIEVLPDDARGATYTVKDVDGKVVEQGQINEKQLIELATGVVDGSLYMSNIAKFAASHAKDKPDGGVREALSGITDIYSQREALREAYGATDGADYDTRKTAYDKMKAADDALGAAKDAAGKAWSSQFTGKGNRAAYEAQGLSEINSAMTNKGALPAAPVDPNAVDPEAPTSGKPERGWLEGLTNTGIGAALGQQPAVKPPEIGTVEDGFVFAGGDPKDPASWKPVAK